MFYSNGASRRLSEDLRSLVHQSLGESKQGVARRKPIDRRTSEEQIHKSDKNVGKRLHDPASQDEFSRPAYSAMLDEFQGTALASRLLAKLQSQANAVL